MNEHALLSASSAHRWIACPGSIALCKDIPNKSSKFADEGTQAHELAATLLTGTNPAVSYGEEMIDYVHKYMGVVKDFLGSGTLMIEKRVDYSSYIGVPDSFGTSDAIIVSEDGHEVTVIDLKYGKGVRVDAEENPQLMLYALGALDELSILGNEIKRVRLVIHQPRLDHISEWDCSIEHLMEFAEKAKRAAEIAMWVIDEPRKEKDLRLTPGEDQCRFCSAKADCPALAKFVEDNVGGGFEDLSKLESDGGITASVSNLSIAMKAIPIIEDWCKAIRAKVESELLSGKPVDGFKLVEGRKGARSWIDKEKVEELLKSMRLKIEQMYDFSLISPTTAEKLFKEQPRRWSKVEEFITRKDGAPSVAPVSDKRQAMVISPPDQGFDVVELNEGD